jgi:hypothetical protein
MFLKFKKPQSSSSECKKSVAKQRKCQLWAPFLLDQEVRLNMKVLSGNCYLLARRAKCWFPKKEMPERRTCQKRDVHK